MIHDQVSDDLEDEQRNGGRHISALFMLQVPEAVERVDYDVESKLQPSEHSFHVD